MGCRLASVDCSFRRTAVYPYAETVDFWSREEEERASQPFLNNRINLGCVNTDILVS